MTGRALKGVLTAAVAFVVLVVLPPSAAAVLSGFNGRIVFVSGRDSADNNDAEAKLYLRTIDSGVGAGSAGPTITPTTGVQHRHPTWSPDRTMVAYAAGVTPNLDIFVLDLTAPGATPQNITNSNNITDDRPAWSPDGTRIAYESELADGSGQSDILIQELPFGGVPSNLTNTGGMGFFEGKPAWSPDSQTLYYVSGDPNSATATNIFKEPAAGGAATLAVADGGVSEFQPSVSPDGTQICYTRGNGGFNNTADVYVAPLTTPPSGGDDLSDNAVTADYNCTWSPDGTKIAYVQGTFTTGDLLMENSDDSGGFVVLEADANNFDGNPDWAPDGKPTCEATTVATSFNTAVSVPLSCADTGPAYEQTPVAENVSSNPTNGTLGTEQQGNPSTVTYTPNPGFTGVDTFTFNGFDARQTADSVTVTVNVAAGGGGGGGGGDGGADTTAPNTEIDKAPKKKTEKHRAKFRFSATEPGSTFECRLDKKKFKPCASPRNYKRLDERKHRFRVRAKDAAENVDASPAKHRWKVLED